MRGKGSRQFTVESRKFQKKHTQGTLHSGNGERSRHRCAYANSRRWCSSPGSERRRFLRGDSVARRALGVVGSSLKTSPTWAATFSRTRSAIRSTSYPLARVRASFSAARSHSMALSKAATLLDRSRRKLRISVVMLMTPPMQDCFVPLAQNDQWNFSTMLAVLRRSRRPRGFQRDFEVNHAKIKAREPWP